MVQILIAKSIPSGRWLLHVIFGMASHWYDVRCAARHARMIERAIRKNGNAWLATNALCFGAPTAQFSGIGQALRAHFDSIFYEPLPTTFIDLSRRIETATA